MAIVLQGEARPFEHEVATLLDASLSRLEMAKRLNRHVNWISSARTWLRRNGYLFERLPNSHKREIEHGEIGKMNLSCDCHLCKNERTRIRYVRYHEDIDRSRQYAREYYTKKIGKEREYHEAYRARNKEYIKYKCRIKIEEYNSIVENPRVGPWGCEEVKFLIANHGNISKVEISIVLQRKYTSVCNKTSRLKIQGRLL